MFKNIFTPIIINNTYIKNRLVFPAINTSYATENGCVTSRLLSFYSNISKGGVGINIIGATSVSINGRVNYYGLRIDDDKFIEGMKKLFSVIKKHGSIPAIQLTHAGNKTTSAIIGSKPVAPSSTPTYYNETSRSLERYEIIQIIRDFGNAALRAKKAGAKAIELHAAHGYLIHQFLSPYTNKRKDNYGGSFTNRIRFLKEIIIEIKEKIEDNVLLLCRISADEFLPGGITIEDSKKTAREIEKWGVDIIDVSAGIYGQNKILYPTDKKHHNIRIDLASKIKSVVNIPIICSGYITSLSQTENILVKKEADFVALGRVLIADPYFVKKSRKKQLNLINTCLWCNKCSYDWQSCERLTCPKNPNL